MRILRLVVLIAALTGLSAVAASPLTMEIKKSEIEIRYKEQKILVYAFATNQFKPYVRELYSLRGENLLRNSPPDHLHHHGLMYAIRLNGVNFWEEVGAPGVERPIKLLGHNTGTNSAGQPEASFTQLISWLGSTNSPTALLSERRTITLSIDEANQEVAVQWQGDFKVEPGTEKVELTGSLYNGLGLRLPVSFDHVAQFHNSENLPYDGKDSRNLIAGKWSSVSGKIKDQTLTAVLFGKSSNAGGPGRFYTLRDPFAYLSVTQNLNAAPIQYSAGQHFSLDYLLAVYPGEPTAQFLNQRYDNREREK